jgi:hypothetical protein
MREREEVGSVVVRVGKANLLLLSENALQMFWEWALLVGMLTGGVLAGVEGVA